LAAGVRFYGLNHKPLHTDEAVNALKFKSLLEDGSYKYDPVEYHGPSLYYFTLIPSLIKSEKTIRDTDEFTLRSVTATASLLLIFFIFLIRKEAGYKLALLAVLLTILSPAVTYYSRYYIHESLLVSFSYCGLISLYLYFSRQKIMWIIFAGIFAGLAFSTKETFIITAGAMLLSMLIVRLALKKSEWNIRINYSDWKYFAAAFLTIFILLFTAFFTNPMGIVDAFLSFENYFTKAGSSPGHSGPWYYYFSLVFFSFLHGVVLSEILYIAFAVVGLYYLFLKRADTGIDKLILFVTLFTFILIVVYSSIPYKTPWLMLTFWHGIVFLAAFGFMKSYKFIHHLLGRTLFITILILFFMHSAAQILWTSFLHDSHPGNPYTYSQPQNDLVNAVEKINEITAPLENGSEVYISVTAPRHEYWPLPWYLRNYSHIGWSDTVRHDIAHFPIILVTPEYEKDLVKFLYEIPPPGQRNLYIPMFENRVELRPNLELRGYIKKDLFDTYYNTLQNQN
jgi:uncharacterized protein (TIGR03663 family)